MEVRGWIGELQTKNADATVCTFG